MFEEASDDSGVGGKVSLVYMFLGEVVSARL
jgi:hypothetical protein